MDKKTDNKKNLFRNPTGGIPVKAGENLQSLTHQQRVNHFLKKENEWKERYQQERGTVVNHSITRG